MKMVKGNGVIDFYVFWHWQYIRRNKDHMNRYLGDFRMCMFSYVQRIIDFESKNPSIVTPGEIIEKIINGDFIYTYPDCMDYDSIYVLNPQDINYKEDEIIDYTEDDFPIYSGEKGYIENSTYIIAIDKNASKETVLADIAHLLDMNDQSREKEFIKSRGISVEDFQKPHRDRARAIGLWLWDRVNELGGQRGAVKEAIAELHETGYLPRLGLTDVEDADLRFYRRRTEECIRAEEILPFTKRGTKR